MENHNDSRRQHHLPAWLFNLIPHVSSIVVIGAIVWTRLAVLESKIEEKWAYAMDERLSIKAEQAAMRSQVAQLQMDITTIKATMQYWQEWNQRQREQKDGGP